MGLGSALSEEEGIVSPPPFYFIIRNKTKNTPSKAKTFIALDASGEASGSMQPTLVIALYQGI